VAIGSKEMLKQYVRRLEYIKKEREQRELGRQIEVLREEVIEYLRKRGLIK